MTALRLALLGLLLCSSLPSQQSLFDGKSLTGWVQKGGRYDGNARWSVEGGCLTGREGPNRAGGLIYTEKLYRNFHFSCQVQISHPFDSGIFLRMVPRQQGKGPKRDRGMQVTLDYRPGGEIAGIYSDGWLMHNKEIKERFKKDAFNKVEVRCTGDDLHTQVWLNGEKVCDYKVPQDKQAGFAPMGRIGLQVHGARGDPQTHSVRFKDITIVELPEHDPAQFAVDASGRLQPTEQGKGAGWQLLFNGKDLSGWQPAGGKGGVAVRDGMLEFEKQGGVNHLRTEKSYQDFELRFDFQIAYMANSGLFLRADPKQGNPAFSGCEVQILDDFNWEAATGSKLKPYQFTGGLYGSLPPAQRAMLPLGCWNTYEVRYKGKTLRVELNGQLLYEVDTHSVSVPKNQKPFAARAARGFIGLQRHAGKQAKDGVYARFKNIYIRELE